MAKKVDTRDSVRTITSNDFITAYGLSDLSLKARKLFYIAISQCRIEDKEFYEYSMPVKSFAELMGISPSHVYEEAERICDELFGKFIKVKTGKKLDRFHVFSRCTYEDDGAIWFKLDSEMTNFFLELKRDFTQPLLNDFIRMKSPYSMAIWHLMQREMKSQKPGVKNKIPFFLSLDELREVTGTQDKLLKLGNFKSRVFDKALREIKDNCGVVVTYSDVKTGHKTTGFYCEAMSQIHVDESEILPERRAEIEAKVKELHERAKQRANGEY